MTALKHVFIFGPDHTRAFDERKTFVMDACVDSSCVVVDTTKTSFFTALRNKVISASTQISLLYHGAPCFSRKDMHCLDMNGMMTATHDVFTLLQSLAPTVPLHIHLFSCYGGLARNNLHHVLPNDGSELVIYAAEDAAAVSAIASLVLSRFFGALQGYSIVQIFLDNLLPITALSGSLNVVHQKEVHIFDPQLDWGRMAKAPQEEIEILQQAFFNFYSKAHGGTAAIVSLTLPTLTPADFLQYQTMMLSMAIRLGKTALLQKLAMETPEQFKMLMHQEGVTGMPLHLAIITGGEFVPLLLEHGADPNQSQHDGYTPLCVATQLQKAEMIQLLLTHGANLHQPCADGTTPFWGAMIAMSGEEMVGEAMVCEALPQHPFDYPADQCYAAYPA